MHIIVLLFVDLVNYTYFRMVQFVIFVANAYQYVRVTNAILRMLALAATQS